MFKDKSYGKVNRAGKGGCHFFPGPLPSAEEAAEGGALASACTAPPSAAEAPPSLPSAAAAQFVARVSVGSPERVAR